MEGVISYGSNNNTPNPHLVILGDTRDVIAIAIGGTVPLGITHSRYILVPT